jgi:iron complex outermembrane recepter protein
MLPKRFLRFSVWFILIFLSGKLAAQFDIAGYVRDAETGESLVGVNIIVKGTSFGTASNRNGNFYLKASVGIPCKLQISMIGYETKEIPVDKREVRGMEIPLTPKAFMSEEIIVRAKEIEVEEKTFHEEVSVEMMDVLSIRESPAANYYEAIRNLKGVDVVMQSMQFVSINARGFNSTENTRFVQMVDGMDNQAPGMNFPIGNIAGLSELDVESIEFIPGPAETQYGGNALNGILLMKSKDPFKYTGVSAYIKPGASDIEAGSDYPFQFSGKAQVEGGIRIAKVFSDRLALKINASYIGGTDWYADDTTNIRPGNIKWEPDPGHDAINKYGDEIIADLPVGDRGANIIVSRTGYKDKELVDNHSENFKASGSLHYKLRDGITAVLHGNFGTATTVYTGDNRISLSGFKIWQAKAEVTGGHFMIRGYSTFQHSGDSYDAKFLAVHLNQYARSDENWFHDYYHAFSGGFRRFGVPSADHREARKFADRYRLNYGTEAFQKVKEELINNTDFRKGAGIKNNSALHHLEGSLDLDQYTGKTSIRIGGSFRFYDLASEGSIFPDTLGNAITFYEAGGFMDISRTFFGEALLLKASARFDKPEQSEWVISPRVYALYSLDETRNIRVAVLTGFRTPGVKELFINKDLGTARYLGGLEPVYRSYDLVENSIYLDQVNAFNAAVEADINKQYGPDQARLKNLEILESGIVKEEDLQSIKPEQVFSFEVGYKSRIKKAFYFDAVYYYSTYRRFIGITKMVKPRTSPAVNLLVASTQVSNSTQHDVYYLNVNSRQPVSVQGLATGFKWLMPLGSILSGNITVSDIRTSIDDPVSPGFNTPRFKSNLSLANRRMDRMENNTGFRNIGFMVTWRYQSRFFWESAFGDGWVEPVSTFDVQFSIHVKKPESVVKLGAANFFNNEYTYSFGGANVGVLYYVSYIVDSIF